MLKITLAQEDPKFNSEVRIPGNAYLLKHPNATSKQLDTHPLWREAIPMLRIAYSSVCGYCAMWIPSGVGNSSVDHYKPKSLYPHLAYEWDNMRLVAQYLNGKKGTWDVLDPTEVEDEWFELNFSTFEVTLTPHVPASILDKAIDTIEKVGINNSRLTELREHWARSYARGDTSMNGLHIHAPFIARQFKILTPPKLKLVLNALRT